MTQEGSLLDRLLHVVWPNRCMFCRKPIPSGLRRCADCDARKDLRTDPARCPICRKLRTECACYVGSKYAFSDMTAPFFYTEDSAPAVWDLKFYGNLLNARKLGDDMADLLNAPETPERFRLADALVPIPLHPRDRRRRGYNQSEEIARQISFRTGIPIRTDALIKVLQTAKQHTLSGQERESNLVGAFEAYIEDLTGKTILLIDDVFTTGNTMNFCADTLLHAGVGQVLCLTATKTLESHTQADAYAPPALDSSYGVI